MDLGFLAGFGLSAQRPRFYGFSHIIFPYSLLTTSKLQS